MNMIDQRVVVTGIGVISSIGIGKDNFWKALEQGQSGIKPITLFDTSTTQSKLAGEILDFRPEIILGEKGLRNLDRTTKLALCASKLALDDSQFVVSEENTYDVGVVLGSTMGSVWSISEFDKEALRNGPRSVNPALFPNTVINSPASQISIKFGIKGFNTTISTGFTSSFEAIEYASSFIKAGRAKAVLVGGVEELCEQLFKGFYKLGFLSKSRGDKSGEVTSPFDRRRNGAILGEGSCVFLIEEINHAINRGAKIYGEIAGMASAFDRAGYRGYNRTGDGLRRAILKALDYSQVRPDEIQYVEASANSTPDGDYAEFRALSAIMNGQKNGFTASASKSMIGETFSASGAFQCAASLLALNNSVIHPTINYLEKDKKCEVDCAPNVPRYKNVNNVLVSCISPMGQNSAMLLSNQKR